MGLWLTLLALCLGTVLAGPVLRQVPSLQLIQQCNNETRKFDYPVGKTLEYLFTSSDGFEEHQPSLEVQARISIYINSPCLWKFTVSDSVIKGPTRIRDKELEADLNNFSLLANYDNGEIGYVSSHKQDSPQAVNIKTAIVSVFQNTMNSLDQGELTSETDIIGFCPTSYSTEKIGEREYVITKRKKLKACLMRDAWTSGGFFGQKYDTPESNVPLLSDEQYLCTQTINKGIMYEAACKQTSSFKPFSSGSVEAESFSRLAIKLANIEDVSETPINYAHYSHPRSPSLRLTLPSPSNPDQEADRTIETINRLSKDEIQPSLPSLSHRLVHLLRAVSERKFNQIYQNLDRLNVYAKDIVLDALPAVGNQHAIKTMVGKIEEMEETDVRIRVWVTSLAFTPIVTSESLRAVLPLMQKKSIYQNYIILGVTSMANKFCSDHPTDCEEVEALHMILQFLSDAIGPNCYTAKDHSELNIKTALKGFGNLGRYGRHLKKIMKCAIGRENNLSVRIEALKALRRMPCSPALVDFTMALFLASSEDEELRIEGYLKTIRCPTKEVIEKIVNQLRDEASDQVKVFVYTHLSNLNASSDPSKKIVRALLKNVNLNSTTFSFRNLTKFSQNLEWSFLNEKYNTGITVDKNLVYSPEAMVPRALNLNLTANLFGSALNLFEFGVRAENVDHYLKQKLRSKSAFVKSFLGKLYQMLNSESPSTSRDSPPKVWNETRSKGVEDHTKSLVSLYTNFVGNELLWGEIKDLENNEFDYLLTVMGIVQKLSQERTIELARSVMFLDSSVTFGTVCGTQQTISVNGTGILALKSDGQFDVRDIRRGDATIQGTVNPSAAIEIDAIWKLHYGNYQAGLKVKASLHSSANFSGHLILKQGRILKFNVDIPKEHNEIISLSTEAYAINSIEGERLLSNPNPKRYYNFCFMRPFSRQFLHVDICAMTNVPREYLTPYSFLNDPVQFKLALVKEDPAIRGYQMEVTLPSKEEREFKLLLDTPGSTQPRRLSIELEVKNESQQEGSFSVKVEHNQIYFSGNGTYKDYVEFKEATLQINDYLLKGRVDFRIGSSKEIEVKSIYNGKLDILSSHENYTFVGYYIESLDSEKHQIRYNLKNLPPSDFSMRAEGVLTSKGGNFEDIFNYRELNTRHRLFLSSLTLASRPELGTLSNVTVVYDHSIIRTDAQFQTNSSLRYKFADYTYETINIRAIKENNSTSHQTLGYFEAETKMTQFPDLSSRIFWRFVGEPSKGKFTHNFGRLVHENGGYYSDISNGEIIVRKYSSPGQPAKYESSASFRSPTKNYESSGVFEYDHSPNNSTFLYNLNTEMKFAPGQSPIRVGFKILKQGAPKILMDVKVKLDHPSFKVEYSDKLEETNKDVYKGLSVLTWGKHAKNASMHYSYSFKNEDHNFGADISIPSRFFLLHYNTSLNLKKSLLRFDSTLNNNGTEYSGEVELRDQLPSKLRIGTPYVKGGIDVDFYKNKKEIEFKLELPISKRRWSAYLEANRLSHSETHVKARINFNETKSSSDKLELDLEFKRSSTGTYNATIEGTYKERSISGSGEIAFDSLLAGPHKFEVDVTNPSTRVEAAYKLLKDDKELSLKYASDEQLKSEHLLTIQGQSPALNLTYVLKLEAKGKPSLSVELTHSHAIRHAHKKARTHLRTIHGENQRFTLDGSFAIDDGNFESNLTIETPYEHLKTQELTVRGNSSKEHVALDGSFKGTYLKEATLGLNIENMKKSLKINSELKTSHKALRNLDINLEYHIQTQTWIGRANINHNDVRIFHLDTEVSLSFNLPPLKNMKMQVNVNIKGLPDVQLTTKIVDTDSKDYELRVSNDSKEIFLSKLTIDKKSNDHTEGKFVLSYKKQSLIDVTVDTTGNASSRSRVQLQIGGIWLPELTTTVSIARDRTSVTPVIEMCAKHKCFQLELLFNDTYNNLNNLNIKNAAIKITTISGQKVGASFKLTSQTDDINTLLFNQESAHIPKRLINMDLEITFPERKVYLDVRRETMKGSLYILTTTFYPNKLKFSEIKYRFDGSVQRNSTTFQAFANLRVPERQEPYGFKLYMNKAAAQSRLDIYLDKKNSSNIIVEAALHVPDTNTQNSSLDIKVYTHDRYLMDFEFNARGVLREVGLKAGMEWSLERKSKDKMSGSGEVVQGKHDTSIYYQHPGVRLKILTSSKSDPPVFEIKETVELNDQRMTLVVGFNRDSKRGTFNLKRNNTALVHGTFTASVKVNDATFIILAMQENAILVHSSMSLKEVGTNSEFALSSHIKPELTAKAFNYLNQSYDVIKCAIQKYEGIERIKAALRESFKRGLESGINDLLNVTLRMTSHELNATQKAIYLVEKFYKDSRDKINATLSNVENKILKIYDGLLEHLLIMMERIKQHLPDEFAEKMGNLTEHIKQGFKHFKQSALKIIRRVFRPLRHLFTKDIYRTLTQLAYSVPSYHARISHSIKKVEKEITKWLKSNDFIQSLKKFRSALQKSVSEYLDPISRSTLYRRLASVLQSTRKYVQIKLDNIKTAILDGKKKIMEYYRNEEDIKEIVEKLESIKNKIYLQIRNWFQTKPLAPLSNIMKQAAHLLWNINHVMANHDHKKGTLKVDLKSPLRPLLGSSGANISSTLMEVPWRVYDAACFIREITKTSI